MSLSDLLIKLEPQWEPAVALRHMLDSGAMDEMTQAAVYNALWNALQLSIDTQQLQDLEKLVK